MGVRDILSRAFGRKRSAPRVDAASGAAPAVDLAAIAARTTDSTDGGSGSVPPVTIDVVPVVVPEPTPAPGAGRWLQSPALQPAVSKAPPELLLHVPDPVMHARQLLAWVADSEKPPDHMLAEEMIEAYAEMCAELRWHEASWMTVGRELARMTGGKRYAWVVDAAGKKHRKRIYRFPARPTGARPAEDGCGMAAA